MNLVDLLAKLEGALHNCSLKTKEPSRVTVTLADGELHGADVSRWQDRNDTPQKINFERMKSAGLSFVYCKVSQQVWMDEDWRDYWPAAKAAGLMRGGYHFLTWDKTPEEQAEYFYNCLRPDMGELLPVVDFEWNSWTTDPSNKFDLLWRFLMRFYALSGHDCMIYTNLGFWGNQETNPKWRRFPLWVADWSGPINYPPPWTSHAVHQYTNKGDGLNYGVESLDLDLNRSGPDWSRAVLTQPEEPEGNMWESNALIAAFDKTGAGEAVNIDYAALKAAGLTAVLVNLGTCTDNLNYDEPYAGAIDNPTRYARLAAARAAGLLALGEYNYSPVMDSVNSYNGRWVLQHINYVTSGAGKPDGAVILTCERYKWWESTREVTCVPTMYAQDLKAVQSSIWPAHRLVAGVRTGRWFLDASKVDFASIMDPLYYPEEVAPLFMAYWMKSNAVVSGNFHDIVKDIPDPAVTTVKAGGVDVNLQAHFLYTGNHAKWRGWECATVRHPAVTDAAGNMVSFRLILWRGSPEELANYFNLVLPEPSEPEPSEPEPSEPEPSEPPEPGDPDFTDRLMRIEAKIDALTAKIDALTAKIDAGISLTWTV